jgi:uncharacterized coiled-coil DUF342 family protein
LNLANQSVVEMHKKEMEYKNRIEELDQQLRSIHNQMQASLDECRTQQDLQETMKIENESIKVNQFNNLSFSKFLCFLRMKSKHKENYTNPDVVK